MLESVRIGTYVISRFLLGICIIGLIECILETICSFISKKIQKRKEIKNEQRNNN